MANHTGTFRERLQAIIGRHVNAAVAAAAEEAVAAYRASLDGAAPSEAQPAAPARAKAPRAVKGTRAIKGSARRASAAKASKGGRRSPEEIADTVSRVREFIGKNPGLSSEKITKAMGGDVAAISDALARLRATKQVKTRGDRRGMTYQV